MPDPLQIVTTGWGEELRSFGRCDYDGNDKGSFRSSSVSVMMPFVSDDSKLLYAATKSECSRPDLWATRVDEGAGSGFIIKQVTHLKDQTECIACDLGHERPNVYCLLGHPRGVGKEADDILLVANAGTKFDFHTASLRAHHFGEAETPDSGDYVIRILCAG